MLKYPYPVIKMSALSLKKQSPFPLFPYYVAYFHQQGLLLDLFQPEMQDEFPEERFDIGNSMWATDFLKHSGMSKAILKKELSFSLGSDHQTLSFHCLEAWIKGKKTTFYPSLCEALKQTQHIDKNDDNCKRHDPLH